MSILRALRILIVLSAAGLAACADQPAAPPEPGPEPTPEPPEVLGLYEFTLTGLNGDGSVSSRAVALPPEGASEALNPVAAGLAFETLTSSSFTEGTRGQGGQRFVTVTYRVRNSTGAPVNNVTFIPVIRSSGPATIAGTPFTSLTLFNGTAASTAIAQSFVPTGAVGVGADGKLMSLFPDVLQVFTEAEVAAIAPPAGVSSFFPYGFVVRNPNSAANRTLAVAANANDFSGLLTFAFRYPLQSPSAAADPFQISFQAIAIADTETRMTESIEERQDTAGVRRARERATALGATTTTVLAGSPAADPFVTDYPGQRQICSVRTSGTAASPLNYITMAGAYTELAIYRPGEVTDGCTPYYKAGTALPANFQMDYLVTLISMDRYGNVKTVPADTVTLSSTDGTAVMPGPAALSGGFVNLVTSYTTYGNSTLFAKGRRMRGQSPVFMNGMTRQWSGNSGTAWLGNNNWAQLKYPGVQDSTTIPGDRPNFPLLVQNTTTGGLTMVNGTTTQPFINLSSFDLTVSGDVNLGTAGTFTGTGRLILTGNSNTVGGGLSNFDVRNLRVTGRYSASSNLNVTGGRIVVQGGRLRSTGFRVRVRPS